MKVMEIMKWYVSYTLEGLVDGNYRVEIYIHLLDLPKGVFIIYGLGGGHHFTPPPSQYLHDPPLATAKLA